METDHTRGRFSAILAPMAISIQFLGAVGTVTGSQFLVTAGDRHVLVDCGMFQGSPEEVSRNRMAFAFDPKTLDALVLTHAHLDHCGRIPALVKAGFRGPIYATAGTADLTEIVLRDAAKLQAEAEARWRKKHPDVAAANAGGGSTTNVFSGDLGRCYTPILRDPTPVSHADFVLVESTYGNREHAPHDVAIEELAKAINEVATDRGVLLIPSFAVGRTQE